MNIGNIVKIKAQQLEYFVWGEGSETIICMHGYGRNANDFEFLKSNDRKIISINLFYHGNSIFPHERIEVEPLTIHEFIALFKEIIRQESVEKFHIIAFSQGGRFTLCLVPFFAEELITITLIAPDRMDNSSFYNWSSRQKWARKLMIHFENNPKKLIQLSRLARRLKLMRPKVMDFVKEFASTKRTLLQASYTWRAFRMILPDYKAIRSSIEKHTIPLKIIMGSFDQVITPKQAYKFAKKINQPNCVVVIQNGHNFFKESSINKFKHLLPYTQQ